MEINFEKCKNAISKKMPFVVYAKPNSTRLVGIFQKNNFLFPIHNYTEKGFAFTAFNENSKFIIPYDQSEIFVETINMKNYFFEKSNIFTEDTSEKLNFEELVKKGITAINNQEFEKVVLSRTETIAIANFDIENILNKILFLYPNTFRYCFYHPKVGLWIGATPEQFIKISNKTLTTMSLAGTQSNTGSEFYIWEKKEQEEQSIVTNYIIETLQKYSVTPKISKPYTVTSGSVVHLKTDIEAEFSEIKYLQNIIENLHPTPAICGFPTLKAKKFILENENYDRAFYTGFLGELNIDFTTLQEKTDLFVNLRCMNITTKDRYKSGISTLFAGCGITKDSIPEQEFIETKNKLQTMKTLLYEYIK